jgi:hypothetical protein
LDVGQRASATADRTAAFKLRAMPIPKKYLMKSIGWFIDLKCLGRDIS